MGATVWSRGKRACVPGVESLVHRPLRKGFVSQETVVVASVGE